MTWTMDLRKRKVNKSSRSLAAIWLTELKGRDVEQSQRLGIAVRVRAGLEMPRERLSLPDSADLGPSAQNHALASMWNKVMCSLLIPISELYLMYFWIHFYWFQSDEGRGREDWLLHASYLGLSPKTRHVPMTGNWTVISWFLSWCLITKPHQLGWLLSLGIMVQGCSMLWYVTVLHNFFSYNIP